jgi:hypothetical protein
MTKAERAFLQAAIDLAHDLESPDCGPKADAKYAIENYCNPLRTWPEGTWQWVDVMCVPC